jgi:Fur family ferric uptake transcriptional regulator
VDVLEQEASLGAKGLQKSLFGFFISSKMTVHAVLQALPLSEKAAVLKSPQLLELSDLRAVLAKRLRARGLRVTRPRVAMINALAVSAHPLSAEQLRGEVEGECDLVTVYRSLASLELVGIVQKNYGFSGTAIYTLNVPEHSYPVLPREGLGGSTLPLPAAAAVRECLNMATDHLRAMGYGNVRAVVQFFADFPKA